MRFDLTPEKPAKWWVWTDDGWRDAQSFRAVVFGRITAEWLVFTCVNDDGIDPPIPVTLSETPPTWRPEQ